MRWLFIVYPIQFILGFIILDKEGMSHITNGLSLVDMYLNDSIYYWIMEVFKALIFFSIGRLIFPKHKYVSAELYPTDN